MDRIASLDIHKEECSFSAGHFTIFSATEREYLHGHNYYVSTHFKVNISHNGLSFDYRFYKNKILDLCHQLDRHFLLPSKSPYLNIEDEQDYWVVYFNHKKMFFLKEDIILLPITNITIEELSYWFLQNILNEEKTMKQHAIQAMTIHVYNGLGQSAGASWKRPPI